MDKDEIIDKDKVLEMARQAGFWKDLFAYPEFIEHLEAFAKLVAEEAAKREREACAKVCDSWSLRDSLAKDMANEIRARGQQ